VYDLFNDDKCLIGTAELPLAAYYMNSVVDAAVRRVHIQLLVLNLWA
jgi:seryl-tRNA synthetase